MGKFQEHPPFATDELAGHAVGLGLLLILRPRRAGLAET